MTHSRRGLACALPLALVLAACLPSPAAASGYAMPAGVTFRVADTAGEDYFPQQWGLDSEENTDINAPEAWTMSTGAGVTVAVVDTGVEATHPDLAGRIRGDGYDYVQKDATPQDGNGHGTEIAGIIAALRDSRGTTGAAPSAMILPLRVFDNSGITQHGDDILSAFDRAGDMGVRVVSASFTAKPSADNADAVARAFNSVFDAHPETLYVVPAGNDDADDDTTPVYPCDATADNVICVGAHERSDRPASFSNWGAENVDLFAPGQDILSTYLNARYRSDSGTSMSAPFVAAEAALLLARVPALTAAGVKALILSTANRDSQLYGPRSVSGGRADAYAALLEAVRDTDADGVNDVVDDCPRVPATGADGCPPVAPPTPTPSPTPTPTPTPVPKGSSPGDTGDGGTGAGSGAADVPRVRRLTATVTRCTGGRACRKSATVKLTPDRVAQASLRVERKLCQGTRCRWTRVFAKAFTAGTRGTKVTVKGKGSRSLPRGTYRVVAVLTTGAGSSKPSTRTFRVL